jgi:hypothetical protein
LPGAAWAGDEHSKGYRGAYHSGHSGKPYNYGHSGKHDNYGHSGHSGKRYRYGRYDGHSGKRYRYGRYDGHSGGYTRKYVTKYKYDDDSDDERLLVGLLVGGIVGYAIGEAHDAAVADAYSPPPAVATREIYTAPRYYEEGGATTCLQEREYQNKVVVGGKTVDAYGTACLQPDGSWRYGPARLASF